MIVQTQEWGSLQVSEDQLVHIPDGLLGFDRLRTYALIDFEESRPFFWLVSTEDPSVCFALADPRQFHEGDYRISLSPSDSKRLEVADGDRLAVLVTVSSDREGRVTANLRGPIVLNTRTRLARQIITYGAGLALRQPIRSIAIHPECAACEPAVTRA